MAAFMRFRGKVAAGNNSLNGSSSMGYTSSSELPQARAQATESNGYVPPAAAEIPVTRPSPVAQQSGGRKVRKVNFISKIFLKRQTCVVDFVCQLYDDAESQGRSVTRRSDKEDMNAR
jgi:hypothetical protein